MSLEQNISQHLSTDYRHQVFGQGLFTKGRGSAFSPHRLVIVGLGLINAVLLIVGVVVGIYCAKAKDLQMSDSGLTPLMVELNYLKNHSAILKAKLEAQGALVKERANYLQVKLQLKQQKTIIDGLQRQIETLRPELTKLKSKKAILEDNCGRCLKGWILLKSSCYYFSLGLSDTMKNWHDSRAHCISQGGDLLVISNMEEQVLLNSNFPKLISSDISGGIWWQNGFWIGLTDVVTQGTWVWVNNATEVENMNWRVGQPKQSGPQSGNCAAYYYADTRRTWYNGNCHDHQLNWICEMEPK